MKLRQGRAECYRVELCKVRYDDVRQDKQEIRKEKEKKTRREKDNAGYIRGRMTKDIYTVQRQQRCWVQRKTKEAL